MNDCAYSNFCIEYSLHSQFAVQSSHMHISTFYSLQVYITDLKIDWIWHLSLKIEAGVIGPTFFILAFKITFFAFLFLLRPYNKYKWNKNAQNVIYNVIYLLKYSKVGPAKIAWPKNSAHVKLKQTIK